MKSIFRAFGLVSIISLLFIACSKKTSTDPGSNLPVVTTTTETDITSTSAKTGGIISSDGGSAIISRGICWSDFNSTPTIADSITKGGSGMGNFSSILTGLTPYTAYYARAYATNASGTGYGDVILILTLPGLLITTAEVYPSNYILSCSTQVSIKGFGFPGSLPVTQSGVCWNTSPNPTVANSKTTYGPLSSIFSDFNNVLTFSINSTYYIRGYATTSAGTTYGNQVTYATGVSIGLSHGGGIIFEVDNTGKHGLIASQTDQGIKVPWAPGNLFTTVTNATNVSDGAANTTKIINTYGNTGTYAAKLCRDYRGGGFNDWYLPSSAQLQTMSSYQNAIGGFPAPEFLTNYYYWNSTEYNYFQAWKYEFNPRYSHGVTAEKRDLNYVRAIRSF